MTIAALALGQTMQAQIQTRRADLNGQGGDGKCTIEVEVDDVAEVEISGDFGRIRTLQGQPAVWRRFTCNRPLPRNPIDFRFRGIDGRGQVQLVRDPRGNGPAVVRIHDPKGGREGYTFDLEWRGGDNSFDSGRYGSGRYGNDRYGNDRYGNSRYDDPNYNGNNRYGNGRHVNDAVIRGCQDAVLNRLDRQGYTDAHFDRIVPDNNPGRNDWVIGTMTARRAGRIEQLSFSCAVDFQRNTIRSVNVNRQ
jgi:hypothetical protein